MKLDKEIRQGAAALDQHYPGYFKKTCLSRISTSGCGSVFSNPELNTDTSILEALCRAEWEPYNHPAIAPGSRAYRTFDIPGYMGIVNLRDLPKDTVVTLDDRKNCGRISATVRGVRGEKTEFTTIIFTDEEGIPVPVPSTFHPGEPVRPSQVETTPGLHGKQIIPDVAMSEYGLETAKIVAS